MTAKNTKHFAKADLEFQDNYETTCPIKYPQEVAYRPVGYNPTCACACETTVCSTSKIASYEITYEYRPSLKDAARGDKREFHDCRIDLCEHHYNQIKNEIDGTLPNFIGSSTWDAMDTISKYCE